MRSRSCYSTILLIALALSLTLVTLWSLQCGTHALLMCSSTGTLELAMDAEPGKLHAFLRTSAGQGPSGQQLTRTLTLTNWDGFSGQQHWSSGSRVRVLGTSDPNFPVRITATSVTLLAAATSRWANRFNIPDEQVYAAKNKSSTADLSVPEQGVRRHATAVRPGLKVLVVRPKFPAGCWAGSGATCSKAAWTATMNASDFTGVNTMLSTCTWNGVTLGGGVTITDDVNLACPERTQTCDDLFNVVYDASNAALATTYDLNSFDHVLYDLQSQRANFPSCRWLGMAVMGGQWIYMHGNCFAGTAMHEMGHNYNLDHSGAYDSAGQVADYGDGSCIMGFQTSFYAAYNANGTGGDIKCFSSPHIYRMGLASYPVIRPSNLPAGAITTRTLAVHWTGPTQALRLTGWGGSDFFLSYQYDGGPNIALTEAGALQAVLLVHQHPVVSSATQDTINFRHTVLAYGSSFALPGTSLVVRIKSMSVDRSSVTVDVCAKSGSQTCAFANDFNDIGPEYLRLRTTANPTWCLAVCSTAAGTECQPAGWAVGQQRAVVLKRDGCTATDDWSLWSVVGSSLRNKAMGWCMDASLIGSFDAGWGQPIIVKPCTFTSTQSFTWRVQPGSIMTAWLQGPVYTSRVNMLSSPVPNQYTNGCPVVCTAVSGGMPGFSHELRVLPRVLVFASFCDWEQSSAPCNSLLPVASQRGTTGRYAMLTFYFCDASASTFNAAPSERYPTQGQTRQATSFSCTAVGLGTPRQLWHGGMTGVTLAALATSITSISNPSTTSQPSYASWTARCMRQPRHQCDNWQQHNSSTAPTPSFSTTSQAPITPSFSFNISTASWTPSAGPQPASALCAVSCGAPFTMAGLPANGVAIFNPPTTTCGAANRWRCRASPDFLYLLPSSSTARTITLDTCVNGVAAWDSFLYVLPVQPNACFRCTGISAFDDDSSPCAGGRSRVTFPAAGGVAYWIVVEGFGNRNVVWNPGFERDDFLKFEAL
ncbi:hypothetical protein QJQ45_024121 [Haematococcus lacustris]|nr:hypothetical protein QJQ45_024121 [Haematococcus lacustris]